MDSFVDMLRSTTLSHLLPEISELDNTELGVSDDREYSAIGYKDGVQVGARTVGSQMVIDSWLKKQFQRHDGRRTYWHRRS